MMKIGVKCEIHSCSIAFMKRFLNRFYKDSEINLVEGAFDIRNDTQYYPDKLIDTEEINLISTEAADFLVRTKQILLDLNEDTIQKIRNELKNLS